ncbi:MAG: type I-C CRISPR-associated endonuclease Cas1c [Acidobacteriota bacterium]|nr:type I-C CRISPR-associated endonuclease Cas1c [Acidobacteriota bacterium]
MRHLLNTLFVTTQGSYLKREGETIIVRVEKETRLQIPVHNLSGIICFGRVSCSPFLMGLCARRGVVLSFLSEHGEFLARVQGPVCGNVLLRREQYRRSDKEPAALRIAGALISAKIANARNVLQRSARDGGEGPALEPLRQGAHALALVLGRVEAATTLDALRGIEGEAARLYFGVFDHLITGDKAGFSFSGRTRRPPLDNVNALLSFVYTLLVHDITGALEAVGLDPSVGFLHRDRPGRPSLALDLMEELRPYLADRLVLSLINRQQVKASGFTTTESGAVVMNDATRKELLAAWQRRKQEEIQHAFIDEKIPLGLLPYVQAMLLARHLRGGLDGYPPFLAR